MIEYNNKIFLFFAERFENNNLAKKRSLIKSYPKYGE